MRKTIAWAAVVCIVLGACAIALLTERSSAAGTAHQSLLAKYEPLLRFDPRERFFPTTVRSFLAARRDKRASCRPSEPVGGLACYAREWKGSRAHPAVYGHVVRKHGRIILQYWLFYDDDVYSYRYPASDFIWQAHEGDWEVVNVVLSAARRPLFAAYSQHCLGRRSAWAATQRFRATHPVVHVAVGSHANYFSAGTHPIDLRCIPTRAVTMLKSRGMALPVDYAFAGRTLMPPLHILAGRGPAWLGFAGPWGPAQYIHAPPPVGTVAEGTSPVGPAFHPVWRNPLGTLARWPG